MSKERLQRIEIIDEDTCEVCRALHGRIVDSNDPVAKMKLVHGGCRGVWEVIGKDSSMQIKQI